MTNEDRDAPKRKKAEESQRASEERLRLVTDALPVLIGYIGADERFRFVNRLCEEWLARPRSEVIGRRVEGILGKTLYERMRPYREAALAGRAPTAETEATFPDGKPRFIRARYVPHLDEEKKVQGYFVLTEDITEQKRAEEALRASEERYRFVVEAMNEGVGATDEDGVFTYVNDSICRMFGHANEELVGRKVADFLDEENRGIVRRELAKRREGGHEPYEIAWTRKDGGKVLTRVSPAPLFAKDGEFKGSFGVITDITERKRAEEALRESERNLAEAQRIAHLGNWEWEVGKKMMRWSDESFRLMGLEPGTPIDTEMFRKMVHPNDLPAVRAMTKAALRGEKPYDLEYRVIRADGRGLVFHSRGEVVRDESGKPIKMFGTALDITDRRRAEEALRESEVRFRAIAANTPGVVYVRLTRPDGSVEYPYVSPASAELLGLAPETIMADAHALFGAIHPDDRERFTGAIREAHETLLRYDVEVRVRKTGGEVGWFRSMADPHPRENGDVLWYGLALDVTDQKRAEEALKDNEERIQLVTDNVPVLIAYLDREERYRFVNRQAELRSNLPRTEILGKRAEEIVGPAYERMRPYIERALAGEAVSFETEQVWAGRGLRHVHVEYVPHVGENGEVIGFYGIVADITEGKRAEAALRESELRLRALADNVPGIVFQRITDPAGRIRFPFIGERLRALTGIEPKAVMADPGRFFDAVHPEDRERLLDAIRESHTRLAPFDLEFRVRRPDGSVVWLRSRSIPFPGDDGKVVSYGVSIDVTDRKMAEAAQRESEERFRDFAEVAADWFWETDADMRFTGFFGRIEEATGTPAEFFIGKSREEAMFGDEDSEARRRHMADVEARRPFRDFVYRTKTQRGFRYLKTSGKPLFADDGRFLGYRGAGIDVTLEVETQTALSASEQRFQAIAANLPGIVFQRISHPDGRIEYPYISAGIRDLAGIDPEAAMADSTVVFDAIHPDDRERFLATLAESASRLSPFETEFRLRGRNDEIVWLRSTTRPVRQDNGDVVWYGFALDITERKKVENSLVETKQRITSILASIEEVFFAVDREWRVTYANRRSESLFGGRIGEIVGTGLWDEFPELASFFYKRLHEAASKRKAVAFEGYYPPLDRWFDVHAYPSLDGGLAVYALDISERKKAAKEIEERDARLRGILENVGDGIVTAGEDGSIESFNPAAERVFGYAAREIVGRGIRVLMPEPYQSEHDRCFGTYLRTGKGAIIGRGPREVPGLRKDGSTVPLDLAVAEMRLGHRRVFIATLRDITERKAREAELRKSEAHYRSYIEVTGQLAWTTNADGLVEEDIPSWRAFTGQSAAEVKGWRWIEALYPDDRERAVAVWRESVATKSPYETEYRVRRRDGVYRYFLARGVPVFAGKGDIREWVGACIDITERKRQDERIRTLAYRDPTTGAPNRVLFADRLGPVLHSVSRTGGSVAVVTLDINRFGAVNDTFGVGVGDRVLKAVFERLDGIPPSRESVARFGSDQFLGMVPFSGAREGAVPCVEKMLRAIEVPLRIGGEELHLTANAGVSLFPEDGLDPDTLLGHSHAALHAAKLLGRSRYAFYSPEAKERVRSRLAVEHELREALERNGLAVLYQPVIGLDRPGVLGVEALVRLVRADGSLVSPIEFLDAAEETHLIVPLGLRVLRTAAAQLRTWQQKKLLPGSAYVSVNLSARQIQEESLAKTVLSVVEETGLSPGNLKLELVETTLLSGNGQTKTFMEACTDRGVGFFIDDFGKGYSSLSYLPRFPIEALKIDRSFIADMTSDRKQAALVNAITAMAHTLGLHAIAEGVENEEQLTYLRAYQCDGFQGYLVTPPLPADEMEGFLSAPSTPPPGEGSEAARGSPA